jgi:hypothetical protein
VQMKADTYAALLHQVSSQLKQNRRSDVRSQIVSCDPPGIGAKKVQESSDTSLELLTYSAVLLFWKVLLWISTLASEPVAIAPP